MEPANYLGHVIIKKGSYHFCSVDMCYHRDNNNGYQLDDGQCEYNKSKSHIDGIQAGRIIDACVTAGGTVDTPKIDGFSGIVGVVCLLYVKSTVCLLLGTRVRKIVTFVTNALIGTSTETLSRIMNALKYDSIEEISTLIEF